MRFQKLLLVLILLLGSQLPGIAQGSIRGEVVRRGSAQPIAGATVVMGRAYPETPFSMLRGPLAPLVVEETAIRTVSDANGKFAFERLPAGDYVVYASAEGYTIWGLQDDFMTNLGSSGLVTVREGSELAATSLSLVPLGTIEGRIRNVYVAAGQVRYRNGVPEWDHDRHTLTDDQGRYRLTGLERSDYYVVANLSLRNELEVEWSARPGLYKVFAIENMPDGAALNAEYLSRYERLGVSVTVVSGQTARVVVQVVEE